MYEIDDEKVDFLLCELSIFRIKLTLLSKSKVIHYQYRFR